MRCLRSPVLEYWYVNLCTSSVSRPWKESLVSPSLLPSVGNQSACLSHPPSKSTTWGQQQWMGLPTVWVWPIPDWPLQHYLNFCCVPFLLDVQRFGWTGEWVDAGMTRWINEWIHLQDITWGNRWNCWLWNIFFHIQNYKRPSWVWSPQMDHAVCNYWVILPRKTPALLEPITVVIMAISPRYLWKAGGWRFLLICSFFFFFLFRLSRRSLHPLLRKVRWVTSWAGWQGGTQSWLGWPQAQAPTEQNYIRPRLPLHMKQQRGRSLALS